jgi:hypothetical protein
MAYNPELVEQLLGEHVASLLDGTIEIIPAKPEFSGNLKVGDTLSFKFKNSDGLPLRQFVVTGNK